jgi:septum formation protein
MVANTSFPSRLYLASRSPRRRELLTQIGIQFDTVLFRNHPREDKEVDETPHPGEAPVIYVERVACAKAVHGSRIVGWRRMQPQPLLAADTALEVDGEIVGKPVDGEDAKAILRRLSGRSHRVLTAVAVALDDRLETRLSVSEVRFCVLAEAQIASYVASGEPMDKAGAYGIQGRAAQFVEHLAGSYSGVMGLPLFETAELLRRFGFPV